MKTNLHIDEQIVAALNFSNMVLLDQCFHQLNYPLINPKNTSTKKQKQYHTKSKFQKVNNKNKQKVFSNEPNIFDNVTLGSMKKHLYDQNNNQIYSKVKICTDEIDIFPQASFINNNNNHNIKVNPIYTPAKAQQYTVNDFLNQTAISTTSRNKFSPINAWKTSSVEKYHPNNFLISAQSSQKQQLNFSKHLATKNNGFFTDHSAKDSSKSADKQKHTSSTTKSVTKKGKKFQKDNAPSSKKTTIDNKVSPSTQINPHIHPIQNNNKTLTIISKTHQYKKQQQLFSQQHSIIGANEQQKSFYDNQTRDTCQLAPSKLQKLIEVEDNKYKQMVLKTFYKHQK